MVAVSVVWENELSQYCNKVLIKIGILGLDYLESLFEHFVIGLDLNSFLYIKLLFVTYPFLSYTFHSYPFQVFIIKFHAINYSLKLNFSYSTGTSLFINTKLNQQYIIHTKSSSFDWIKDSLDFLWWNSLHFLSLCANHHHLNIVLAYFLLHCLLQWV